MISPVAIQFIALGLCLLASLMCIVTLRLRSILRLYAFASLMLAVYAAVLAWQGGEIHFWAVAALTVLVKVAFVPWILSRSVRKSHALERLQTSVRPTTSLLLALVMVLGLAAAVSHWPFVQHAVSNQAILLSVEVFFVGMLLLIFRRDVLSQIIGFLTIENGISAFAFATITGVPALLEAGIFGALMFGALLMATLSHHVQTLYGTEDTKALSELTD
ncbi:hypothetical protein HYV73_02080 [Candidatus Uhrbacteria bacterium]|nr:hypothetical protein [Candidatus Uhrbacteria bacterium]